VKLVYYNFFPRLIVLSFLDVNQRDQDQNFRCWCAWQGLRDSGFVRTLRDPENPNVPLMHPRSTHLILKSPESIMRGPPPQPPSLRRFRFGNMGKGPLCNLVLQRFLQKNWISHLSLSLSFRMSEEEEMNWLLTIADEMLRLAMCAAMIRWIWGFKERITTIQSIIENQHRSSKLTSIHNQLLTKSIKINARNSYKCPTLSS